MDETPKKNWSKRFWMGTKPKATGNLTNFIRVNGGKIWCRKTVKAKRKSDIKRAEKDIIKK